MNFTFTADTGHVHQVGSWQLDARPLDIGPTWQDHLATHAQFPKEHRRVRIYLVERNSAKAARASIERAARREMLALHGISHPGMHKPGTGSTSRAFLALNTRTGAS